MVSESVRSQWNRAFQNCTLIFPRVCIDDTKLSLLIDQVWSVSSLSLKSEDRKQLIVWFLWEVMRQFLFLL